VQARVIHRRDFANAESRQVEDIMLKRCACHSSSPVWAGTHGEKGHAGRSATHPHTVE
jgi:uncharacterized membrane protein